MHKIILLDKKLFHLVNYSWHNDFFDFIMPWLRNAEVWAPLYFFLILLVTVNYKKNSLWWICFFICTVIIANYISSNLIKPYFDRIRPCNNPEFVSWIRILTGYRPMNPSFVSSHAANHFAMATFFYITLKKKFGNWVGFFFVWAFCISYAQIYVGVHYPMDVLAGALLGSLIGFITAKLFNRYFMLSHFLNKEGLATI